MFRPNLSGKNRIAEEFYNGPRFQKFRFWENLFLWYAGGLKGARRQILRHLPPLEGGRLLEVGIGDGANLALLPEGVEVVGVDLAMRRLQTCREQFARGPAAAPQRELCLALAEGEHLPFPDRAFDAVLCVGGFNFFSDPAGALREMARVTRAQGRVVVADEIPDFHRYGWGHRIGVPRLDYWLMRRWFGPEFAEMAWSNELDVDRLAEGVLDRPEVHRIWRGYGYCLVGTPHVVERQEQCKETCTIAGG